jgi:hypothetical protein
MDLLQDADIKEGITMNLYLISTEYDVSKYGKYDSFVVASESPELAREYHPDGSGVVDWGNTGWSEWAETRDRVSVIAIGVANDSLCEGQVVLASYNE